ncbi:unnamed protein product [Heligmosomoides polygyrus]|uniref:MGAT4 conserved region domain-containing protein n=1 Tax=Heligmosomoides polygyrus TaxID=6339 RepID=A0A3P8BXY7_HELPZ|nr:unnamed protein product [Heligmosomoides polygyrus]
MKQRRPWFSMHFTNLGFIGKMFRSEDIKYLTHAIALYYQYKPVDWILSDVEYSRYCSPEHNTTQCQRVRQFMWIKTKIFSQGLF